jgi:hypothetical protein
VRNIIKGCGEKEMKKFEGKEKTEMMKKYFD